MEVVVVLAVVVVIVAVVLLVAGGRRGRAGEVDHEPSLADSKPVSDSEDREATSPPGEGSAADEEEAAEDQEPDDQEPDDQEELSSDEEAEDASGVPTEEKQAQQIAGLEALCADLGNRVEELQTDLRRYRRWANTQLTRISEELDAVWKREKLPSRVSDLGKKPSEEGREQLRRLAEPLENWMDELELGEAEVFHRIGMWHALEGRSEQSATAFHEAVTRGMGMEAWLALGDTLWFLDRRKKARDAYRPCKGQKRVPVHVFHRCALVAFDERRFEEALSDLEQVLNRRKPDVELFTLASLACGKLGNHERAVSICEDGLKKHPDSAILLANMIIPLNNLGETDRVHEVYEQARELDEELADVPFSMGVAEMHSEDYEAALDLLGEAVELREDYPEAFFCMGVIRNKQGEYAKAIEQFKLAVELRPDYAEAYYNMKDSYDRLRDFESSIAMLEKAVALNPGYK